MLVWADFERPITPLSAPLPLSLFFQHTLTAPLPLTPFSARSAPFSAPLTCSERYYVWPYAKSSLPLNVTNGNLSDIAISGIETGTTTMLNCVPELACGSAEWTLQLILKENWTLFIWRSRNHIVKHALNVGYQGGTECHGGIMISKSWDKRLTEPSTRHINLALGKTGKYTARCADLLRNCYDRVKETLGETSALVWKIRMNLQEFIKFLDGPKLVA